jgi:ribonuclease R
MNKKISTQIVQGTLRLHPRGFGFIVPFDRTDSLKDIFISADHTEGAVDGDQVEAEVYTESLSSSKGPEGKILTILKRGREYIVGLIQEIDGEKGVRIYSPLLGSSRPILAKYRKQKQRWKIGDRVLLHIIDWGKKPIPTQAEICQYLGNIADASLDVDVAAREFELEQGFSQQAIEEAEYFGSSVTRADEKGRRNLKSLISLTIDPKTAKDFDDALSLSEDEQGNFHLGVHIADVAHYVKEGSVLDLTARNRCNSTYFPGRCVPMLPEQLSNHLCSLRPNVARLTVTVLMTFNREGDLIDSEVLRSVIKSRKRFTYEEAKSVLDGVIPSPYAPVLHQMMKLCLLLKRKRTERGSIDFALPDLVLEVDSGGEPIGYTIHEYDITHQLVEEFMLKANEVVAHTLSKKGAGVLFRIHEEPALENMGEFCALARSLGFSLIENPTKKDIQMLFEEAKQSPAHYQLAIAFIRSMKLAIYSPENIGHYGLALEYYCHFTSPIRRYSDLITERLLFDEHPNPATLSEIALLCSERERISFRAEMSVKTLKKLRLLKREIEQDPQRIYSAVISRVKPFGVLFEIAPLMFEGFLHISQLENDYFMYDNQRDMLVGRRTGKIYKMGSHLQLLLVHIDLIVQETKWEIAGVKKQSARRRKSRR